MREISVNDMKDTGSPRQHAKWFDVLLGVFLIALGIFTFFRPGYAMSGLVVLYGAGAVLTGVSDILRCSFFSRKCGVKSPLSLVAGLLSVVVGVLIFLNIDAGRWLLSVLVPVWFASHCISRIGGIRYLKKQGEDNFEYYISLAMNILGLVFGVLLLLNPSFAYFSIVYLVGFALVAFGIGSIISVLP